MDVVLEVQPPHSVSSAVSTPPLMEVSTGSAQAEQPDLSDAPAPMRTAPPIHHQLTPALLAPASQATPFGTPTQTESLHDIKTLQIADPRIAVPARNTTTTNTSSAVAIPNPSNDMLFLAFGNSPTPSYPVNAATATLSLAAPRPQQQSPLQLPQQQQPLAMSLSHAPLQDPIQPPSPHAHIHLFFSDRREPYRTTYKSVSQMAHLKQLALEHHKSAVRQAQAQHAMDPMFDSLSAPIDTYTGPLTVFVDRPSDPCIAVLAYVQTHNPAYLRKYALDHECNPWLLRAELDHEEVSPPMEQVRRYLSDSQLNIDTVLKEILYLHRLLLLNEHNMALLKRTRLLGGLFGLVPMQSSCQLQLLVTLEREDTEGCLRSPLNCPLEALVFAREEQHAVMERVRESEHNSLVTQQYLLTGHVLSRQSSRSDVSVSATAAGASSSGGGGGPPAVHEALGAVAQKSVRRDAKSGVRKNASERGKKKNGPVSIPLLQIRSSSSSSSSTLAPARATPATTTTTTTTTTSDDEVIEEINRAPSFSSEKKGTESNRVEEAVQRLQQVLASDGVAGEPARRGAGVLAESGSNTLSTNGKRTGGGAASANNINGIGGSLSPDERKVLELCTPVYQRWRENYFMWANLLYESRDMIAEGLLSSGITCTLTEQVGYCHGGAALIPGSNGTVPPSSPVLPPYFQSELPYRMNIPIPACRCALGRKPVVIGLLRLHFSWKAMW